MAQLIAHRGQSANLPENTLQSMRQAIFCGATAVEFDLQMTVDHVPVVSHDISLLRTAGVDVDIAGSRYAELIKHSVGFAGGYPDIWLPTLQEMVALLRESPQVMAFVELKDETIEVFGIEPFVHRVVVELLPLRQQCVVIANSLEALLQVRKQCAVPVGWIVHRWEKEERLLAQQCAVDYLVISHELCYQRAHDFSTDPWLWVVYETSEPEVARALFAQGIQFVETNDICSMMQQIRE